MKLLQSLSVRRKLAFAFGCVLLLMTALCGVAWYELAVMADQSQKIITYRISGVRDSGRMVQTATRLRVREFRLAVSAGSDMDTAVARYRAGIEDFDKASKEYEAFILDAHERKLFDAAMIAWRDYMTDSKLILAAAQAGQPEEAVRQTLTGVKKFDVAVNAMGALIKFNDDGATADAAAAQALYELSLIHI